MKSPFSVVKYVNSAFLRVKYPLVMTNIAIWKDPPCYFYG